MYGRQGALVTGVHSLQHVERLGPPHLTDNDSIRPHTQSITQQVSLGHLVPALNVGWPRLARNNVPLVELEFDGVLDGYDALSLRDISGKGAEKSRLTGTRSAGYDDIEPQLNGRPQEVRDRLRQRPNPNQVLHVVLVRAELSDCDRRRARHQRRDDDVDTGTVWQSRINERRGLVHTAP